VADAEAIIDEIYLGEHEIPARGRVLLDRALGEVEILSAVRPFTLAPVDAVRGSDERDEWSR
jgi:hypothetical protein